MKIHVRKVHVALWLVPAFVAAALTFVALGIGGWELLGGKNIEAANWVMAAGGLGIIVFSWVQLYRDARREAERVTAAGAKVKPAAWVARRMCEDGLIASDGQPMKQWLARWYVPSKVGPSTGKYPIEILEHSMREMVTLAAEAGGRSMYWADEAFGRFITAANILNDLNATVSPAEETPGTYLVQVRDARRAADNLAAAGRCLETLAPGGKEEPEVPVIAQFRDEGVQPPGRR